MTKNINRDIIKLALPNIVSNITVPLLSLIDLALMGHLGSEKFIGAVALGSVLFNFIYWGFSFLRMGTSGLTGQAYGRGDKVECDNLLKRSLSIALFIGLAILILKVPIGAVGFYFIDGSPDVKELAISYFNIRVWAAPATLSIYSLMGWFIGMQNSKIPMYIAIFINIVNIIFNTLFIYGFNMTSDGVAYGTVIAQYSGFLLSLYLIKKHFKIDLSSYSIKDILSKSKVKIFFNLNRDIFIRTLSIITVFTFFTSQSASIGDTTLAVNTFMLQFIMFFSFFMDGFAYAGEALVAKFYGAKDFTSLKIVIKLLFVWGAILTAIYSIIYYIWGIDIISLLTDNLDILEVSRRYIAWVILVPLASFGAFIWDGIYIGITASKGMRNTILISTIFVFFPVWYFTNETLGNHSLWLAMILFFASRSVTQTILAKKHIPLSPNK